MRMLGPNSRRRLRLAGATLCAGAATLALPAAASADSLEAYNNGVLPDSVAINTLWVIVAGMVVMFMQAGFAFLEIGFSRGKNAGTVIAKILTNFSIAALMYYAIGFAFAFGPGDIIGSDGFFLRDYGDPQETFAVMGLSERDDRVEVVLPVRLLRRLARDRLGHDARADQVRRLHHLRRRLRRR